MKAKILMISCGIIFLTSACNNGSKSESTGTDTSKEMAKDTAVAVTPAPAETAPAIDSAAVTREYLAAQKKTKKTTPAKPKKQGKNEVIIYNEETIPAHEALEQPVATTTSPAPEKVIHTKEMVYFAPSENPSFPGGNAALKDFIKKTMVYPEDALNYHVEGTVYAEVYLDASGNVTNVEFPATHVGHGLEEETRTILMGSPRWHPARENGQPVKSVITVPVVYRIKH